MRVSVHSIAVMAGSQGRRLTRASDPGDGSSDDGHAMARSCGSSLPFNDGGADMFATGGIRQFIFGSVRHDAAADPNPHVADSLQTSYRHRKHGSVQIDMNSIVLDFISSIFPPKCVQPDVWQLYVNTCRQLPEEIQAE